MHIFITLAIFCLGVGLQSSVDGFKVLALYNGNYDLAHISYVGDCNKYFPSIQAQHGFTYESSTDWGKLNDNYLRDIDVVMFLDGQPYGQSQKDAFRKYVEGGGGFIGYHVSAFTQSNGDWSWYHNTLLGTGDFVGNTWRPTSAVLQVEATGHPAVARLPATFKTQPNEWYSWTNDLRQNPDIQILLSIHESSFPLGTGPNPWEIWYDGYYPVVWTNKKFNSMYVNMGHNDIAYENNNEELSHTFDNEVQNRLYIDGLKWLAGESQKRRAENQRSPLFKALLA
jgi:hypothetical protein